MKVDPQKFITGLSVLFNLFNVISALLFKIQILSKSLKKTVSY